MKCPYCENEMQKGVLSGDGRSAVTWKAGEDRTGFFDRFLAIGRVTAAKQIFDTDIQSGTDLQK